MTKMKNSKNILILTMICGAFATLQAQSNGKDTTYRRQISVERDYNPTLQDANKINTQPSIYEPTVKKADATLAAWSTSGIPKMLELGKTGEGNFGTDVEHDKKIGYIGLRLGTCANIEGEAGIQAISKEKTRLDFLGTYNSSSAEPKQVDYLTKNNVKAKYNNLMLKAAFQQKLEPLTFYLAASYEGTGFNYYGATYATNGLNTTLDNKQTANSFQIGGGVKSKEETILRYAAYLSYNNLALKYGYGTAASYPKGPAAGVLKADVNFNADFGTDCIIGINIHALNQSLSSNYDTLHTLTNFQFNPYINFTGSNWNANLGANGHITLDKTDKILLTPNLSASWNFETTSSLYAAVTGGIGENTFLDILRENRYANPTARITPSRTYYDATLGIKTGAIKGMEFDFFGGYKYTTREHLYYSSTVGEWQNVSSAMYAKLGQGKLGGLIKTNLIPYTDLSARLTTYFYTVKYENESATNLPKAAWNKPTYTLEMNVDIKPIKDFVVSANYVLAGGRKYYNATTNEKGSMNSINELNAKGSYQFNKMVSVSVAINNFLNQKYEYVPGYVNYEMNILGGVSVKF